MAQEWWINTTGSTWKRVTEAYVNTTGSTWKEITEAYVNTTGSTWKQYYSKCSAASCIAVTTVWGENGGVGCTTCTAGYCSYCMRLDWTNCVDACHNVKGELSTNGGSWLGSLSCTNQSCSNDSGCDCSAGAYDFSCEITKNCVDNTDSYQGRLSILLDSDSSTVCGPLTGQTKTGVCAA